MQSKDGKHSNSDDAALFRDAVGDVSPLNSKKNRANRHQPKPARPTPKAAQRRRDERDALAESMDDVPVDADVETGEELSFRRDGVDSRVFRKMRSGNISVREEVDLHGLRRDEARTYLRDFIRFSHKNGLRCVRVVHGKGLGSGPDGPVLKHGVNNWLRSWDEVLAFCSAPPNDGGTGAIYVLLKAR